IPFARPSHPPALTSLSIGQPIGARFGDSVRLVGATIGPSSVLDGDVIPFTLIWQVERAPASDLTLTVRLTNPAGATLAQSTATPTSGVWRAADWQPGDVIVDRQRVLVPAGTASASATLSVGLSDAAGRPLLVAGQRDSLAPIGGVEV